MEYEDFRRDSTWGEDLDNIYRSFHKEINIDGEYDKFGVCVEDGDIVIDCGASIGLFSVYARERGAGFVYAIEAEIGNYTYLKENVGFDPCIYPINGMVGSEYSLRRLVEDVGIERIDFMKVDIEGSEYSFILDASDEHVSMVKKWAIEVHVWHNISENYERMFLIVEKLSRCGFSVCMEKTHKGTCLYMMYASKRRKYN